MFCPPPPALLSAHAKLKFGKLKEKYSYSSQFIAQICLCFANPPIEREASITGVLHGGGVGGSPTILNKHPLKVPCTWELICDPLTALHAHRRQLRRPEKQLRNSYHTVRNKAQSSHNKCILMSAVNTLI